MVKKVTRQTREEFEEPDQEQGATEELEHDPIEELKLCKSSVMYIFRIDTVTRSRRRIGQVTPEGLSWEFLERFGPGDYYIAAHYRGKYIASRTVFLDPPLDPNTNPSSPPNAAGVHTSHAIPGGQEALVAVAEILKEALVPIVQHNSRPPDAGEYMKTMASAFQQGMEMAIQAMPKPQEPDRMFDILDRVLEIKDRIGTSDGDWKERILGMVAPIVSTMVEKSGERENLRTSRLHPPHQYGAGVRPAASEEVVIAGRTGNPPPPQTQPTAGVVQDKPSPRQKIAPADFVFEYTRALAMRAGQTDPELRAEVFLEDLPPEFEDALMSYMRNENSFGLLQEICPHISEHLEWFRQWHDEIKSLLFSEGEGRGEDTAAGGERA